MSLSTSSAAHPVPHRGSAKLAPFPRRVLPWITTTPGLPYFHTEDGQPFHPIGQNDAISWRELNPLFGRKDVPAVVDYLQTLQDHGVTTLRLMLEYAQVRSRYFETRPGKWSRNVVQFWDDLFALCEQHNLRILLTPFDTFWMWIKFKHHPYNAKKGGTLHHPSRALLCPETRKHIKARLTFAAERWGGSGALFAWDLWNEIHPAQAEMSAEPFVEFIEDLSEHLRQVETRAHGRSHPQTVSLFGPELRWRAEMQMEPAIFRHPSLDFATIHIYEEGTIDHPRNTVDAAVGMGRIVKASLAEITDSRPFFDSEHGPIHTFKDHRKTLPEAFDDEYFRHMQWAHLASGATAGGMRWPNRRIHSLTPGMRRAQQGLANFLPAIDWLRFHRTNVTSDLCLYEAVPSAGPNHTPARHSANRQVSPKRLARFACATPDQAVLYLLRRDNLLKSGRLDRRPNRNNPPLHLTVSLPILAPGEYHVEAWDTLAGQRVFSASQRLEGATRLQLPPFRTDLAVALRRTS